jgi:hypothetical protein
VSSNPNSSILVRSLPSSSYSHLSRSRTLASSHSRRNLLPFPNAEVACRSLATSFQKATSSSAEAHKHSRWPPCSTQIRAQRNGRRVQPQCHTNTTSRALLQGQDATRSPTLFSRAQFGRGFCRSFVVSKDLVDSGRWSPAPMASLFVWTYQQNQQPSSSVFLS